MTFAVTVLFLGGEGQVFELNPGVQVAPFKLCSLLYSNILWRTYRVKFFKYTYS